MSLAGTNNHPAVAQRAERPNRRDSNAQPSSSGGRCSNPLSYCGRCCHLLLHMPQSVFAGISHGHHNPPSNSGALDRCVTADGTPEDQTFGTLCSSIKQQAGQGSGLTGCSQVRTLMTLMVGPDVQPVRVAGAGGVEPKPKIRFGGGSAPGATPLVAARFSRGNPRAAGSGRARKDGLRRRTRPPTLPCRHPSSTTSEYQSR